MTAYAESQAALPSVRTGGMAVTWRGIRAGLYAAIGLAIWFLFVDYGNHRPLYTPTLLGTKMFGSGGVLPPAISFTMVHGLVFALIGIAAAHLENMIERGSFRVGLMALLVFVILNLAFGAFALSARAIGLEALSWPAVLIGNGIAAMVMIGSLWPRHLHDQT